jgi:probable selenium-dependent hydroxylase accessory protein YqeC
MRLFEALGIHEKGIVTAVGAGGKSSLLFTLMEEWREAEIKHLLTTTTKMSYEQVASYGPIISDDFYKGIKLTAAALRRKDSAAWFSRRSGDKVVGLYPDWVDKIFETEYVQNILVEGDGANRGLIKAAGGHEPVVPSNSQTTIGILNLSALGKPLLAPVVHRLFRVSQLLGKQMGERIVPNDIGVLAGHPNGIFKGSRGKKVLVLSGAENICKTTIEEILEEAVAQSGHTISICVITSGYGTKMKPNWVFNCE